MDKTDRYISVADIGKVCHLHEEGDIEIFEIVRCKDCKFADEYGMCGHVEWYNKPDDFCSRGERREDGGVD